MIKPDKNSNNEVPGAETGIEVSKVNTPPSPSQEKYLYTTMQVFNSTNPFNVKSEENFPNN